MIVDPNSHSFTNLFKLVVNRTDRPNPSLFFACDLASSVTSIWLMKHSGKSITIISSPIHTVVYDGESTWDLSLGVVFPNYKYPDPNPPEYISVNLFGIFFDEILFNNYYCEENLKKAKQKLSYITLSHGEENGTKKKTS